MKMIVSLFSFLLASAFSKAQDCNAVQTLDANQSAQLSDLLNHLENSLQLEDLDSIEFYTAACKQVFGNQAGLPETAESYYSLTAQNMWLDLQETLNLTRLLVAQDSLTYVNLWKLAKGIHPSINQAHSIFLRTSAEYALAFLQIAVKETDETRKQAYESWAYQTFDSLLSMQLPSGAFPFPDLRTYNDPVFTPIIQQFLLSCGSDSVIVLQNGWIVDDYGTGEFKFDAGVIAHAFKEAYFYSANELYKEAALACANYLLELPFSLNYNYNTFVAKGLMAGFELSNDSSYLQRAAVNLRYAVIPGQITTGKWMDGHNAKSVYHAIMIENMLPIIRKESPYTYNSEVNVAFQLALRAFIHQEESCQSSTGFKALTLACPFIADSLRLSAENLVGKYINQVAINGKYADLPSLAAYVVLLQSEASISAQNVIRPMVYYAFGKLHCQFEQKIATISLCDLTGRKIAKCTSETELSCENLNGLYFVSIVFENGAEYNTHIYIDM